MWIYHEIKKMLEEDLFDICQFIKENDTPSGLNDEELIFSLTEEDDTPEPRPSKTSYKTDKKKTAYEDDEDDEESKYLTDEIPTSEEIQESHAEHSDRLNEEVIEENTTKKETIKTGQMTEKKEIFYEIQKDNSGLNSKNYSYIEERAPNITIVNYGSMPADFKGQHTHARYVVERQLILNPHDYQVSALDLIREFENELKTKIGYSEDFNSHFIDESNSISDKTLGSGKNKAGHIEFYINEKISPDSIDDSNVPAYGLFEIRIANDESGGCGAADPDYESRMLNEQFRSKDLSMRKILNSSEISNSIPSNSRYAIQKIPIGISPLNPEYFIHSGIIVKDITKWNPVL